MYIPVATLLAARQLEAAAPASNAARDLSRAIELLSRQDTAFIPKTDSQAQKDFEAEQAASSAAAAKATACAVAASAGLPCSREVRRDLASMIATASGTARREFISSPQRRQDTAFIPKTDSQEQQDFDAEQAASSAAAAAQTACLVKQSAGLPCTREVRRQDTAFIPKTDSQEQKDFEAAQAASAARAAAETACAVRASAGLPCDPVRRQDTAFIPKTDSQEQKDFDAAQAASAAAAAAQTACLVKQSAGLPCTRELAPLSRRQDTAFIPKTDSQEQKDFDAAQAASSAAAAAQTACLVRASAGLPCTREISQVRRQDTAFIPKTDSQEQKDFDAAQAASAAAAAAQTACLVRASAGLPCTREVADLMVRSLIADLD